MSEYIYKRHNESLLLYHLVYSIKYRQKDLSEEVSITFREICLEISKRYEIYFLEIGCGEDYVLIQYIPMLSPKRIVSIIKNITA